MKKNILFFIALLITNYIDGQIGIFTESPKSIFHIDGLANNQLNENNLIDDVSIQSLDDGSIAMGIGNIPEKNTSIQLNLAGNKSGLMLNRVVLNANDDISAFTTTPLNGTIVYNTMENSELTKGIFYFKDGIWYPLDSRNIISQIKYLNLSKDIAAYTATQTNEDPSRSNNLEWIDPTISNATSSDLIKLPETASYAFTIRIWGKRPTTSGDARLVIYVWLLKEGSKIVANVLDVAELNIPVPAGASNYSYSVTLSASVNAGDNVRLSIGAPNASGSTLTMNPGSMIANTSAIINPDRTSLIYWKLQ